MRYNPKFLLAGIFATAGVLTCPTAASAANTPITYSGATATDISVGTDWTGGAVPGVTNDAVFSQTAASSLTLTSANVDFGSLDDTGAGALTITLATGKALTLGGSGDLGNATSGTATDLLYVKTGDSLTIAGTGTLTVSTEGASVGTFDIVGTGAISSIISGGAFNKTGTGTLTISGANTYTGGTTLTAGTLTLGSTTALGTGALTIAGGSLNSSVASLVLSNNNVENWNGNFTFVGLNALSMGTGAVTLGTNITATVSASTLSVGGAIGDGGSGYSLTKAGTGTLYLSGSNTYSGGTSITAGELDFDQTTSMPASGTIAVSGSAILDANIGGTGEFTNGTSGGGTIGGLFAGTGGQGAAITFAGTTSVLALDTTNATGTVTYSGNISSIAAPIFEKLGTGTLDLTGDNTFTSKTAITTGTLQFGQTDSMSSGTGSSVTVGAGAMLEVNAGGTGEFTTGTSGAGTIGGLLAGTGGQGVSVAYVAGSYLGINVTDAPGGTLTYAGNISAFTPTFENLGGNLILSGNLSNTGAYNSLAGTLTFTGTNTNSGLISSVGGVVQFIANAGNTTAGVSSALSPNATLNVLSGSGTEYDFRSDSNVAFDVGSLASGDSTVAVTFNVGSVEGSGAATNKTITIQPSATASQIVGDNYIGYGSGAIIPETVNVTGSNEGYTLNLSDYLMRSKQDGDLVELNANGASLIFGELEASNSADKFELTGTSTGNELLEETGGGTELIKAGSGTWLLSSQNGVDNGVPEILLQGGILQIDSSHSIANTSVYFEGGTLEAINTMTLESSAAAFAPLILYTAGGTIMVDAGQTLTVPGVISGTVATYNLTQTGSGTLVLSGANTYVGQTIIDNGTLETGSNVSPSVAGSFGNAASAIAVGDAGSLAAANTPTLLITAGGVSISRAVTIGSASGANLSTYTVGANNTTGTATYSGTLTFNQAGTLVAGAGGTTDFSTALVLNNNALTIGATGYTGIVELDQNLTTTGGVAINDGTLNLVGNLTGNATIGSGATLTTTSGSGGAVSGTVTDNGGTVDGGTVGDVVVGGLLTFNGSGNAVNNYVYASSGATLGSGASVNLNSGSTLDGSGTFAIGNGTVTGSGSVTSGLAATLNTGTINLSTGGSIGGTLAVTGGNWNGVGSVGGLVTSSSGTFTVGSGGVLTATSGVKITGGKMIVLGSTSSGTPVAINSGGTLAGAGLANEGTLNGSVTMASGGAINLQDGVIGTMTTGALTVNGGTLSFDIGSGSTGNLDSIAASGTLTIGGAATIDIGYVSGTPTLTDGTYSLITYTGATLTSAELADLTLNTSALTGASGDTFSLTNNPDDLELTISGPIGGTTPAVAYWSGATNSSWQTTTNFNTSATSGTAVSALPGSTTDVVFSTSSPVAQNLSTTLDAATVINSLTFNSSSGNVTIASGTGGTASTLTLEAATTTGGGGINTAPAGITMESGAGSVAISAPVILGASQTWSNASSNSLTVSGQISGAYGLTTAGSGTIIASNSAGNIYSGGTTISGGTFYANNASGTPAYVAPGTNGRTITAATSGSATGTGAVIVASGGTLAGTGSIAPTVGGVTVQSGGTFAPGGVQSNASPYSAGPGMTLNNAAALPNILTTNGGSTLTFALGAGTSTGALAYSNPNTNSTYLTIAGNTAGEVSFATSGATTIDLVDLTTTAPYGTSLSLRQQNPYLLVQAGADSDYNLVTSGGYDQNGLVLGTSSNGGTSVDTTAFNLEVTALGSTTPINSATNYEGLQLYLYNGDLEVVPEPSTWAMMLGGLAALIFWQRRRRANASHGR